ncbi:EspA/EspE family type VII secretion system effector [Mycobacterium marinum]|uniref:EspA/EspE family type VII secretion system effector n=1 Tax=Mycobacterium marinum TaxID=1781 RepID=UPI00115D3064|nr:EspA/EspE family type VII secretion system effector [Mycobacterium marinum]
MVHVEGDVGQLLQSLLHDESAAEDRPADNPHALRRGTLVCGCTLVILVVVQGLLGEQSPDQGDGLVSSGSIFDDVGAQIAALDPSGGWQGSAAQAYWAQNLTQAQYATLMTDLDRLAAELVSSQARAVKKVRDAVLGLIALIVFVFFLCSVLECKGGPEGQLASFHLAALVCSAVLFITFLALIDLAVKTSGHASDMQAVTQRVNNMSAALSAYSSTISGSPEMALAPANCRSEFNLADRTGSIPTPPIWDRRSPS